MDKKTKNGSGKKKGIFKKKQILAIVLVSIIFLVGSTTFKLLDTLRPVAIGVSTEEVFTTMILNNQVKSAINEEIQKMKREKIKIQIEAIREAAKKKIEAEKQAEIEAEKRAQEKAEEVRKIEAKQNEKNGKVAYLTFDDGPSIVVTPRILDILDGYDIKATFFVLGKMADANEEMLKRIHNNGHALGHHSYSHDYNHIYRSTGNFIGEIERTSKVFKRVLGEEFETRLLRLPGGSFEKSKQKFVKAAGSLGYENYDWNALNGDAEGHNLPKGQLVNRLKTTVSSKRDKKEMIILMHDTDAKSTTADALPEIIEYLIKEGYEFRTLNQK